MVLDESVSPEQGLYAGEEGGDRVRVAGFVIAGGEVATASTRRVGAGSAPAPRGSNSVSPRPLKQATILDLGPGVQSGDTARAMSQENAEVLRQGFVDWNRGEFDVFVRRVGHEDVELHIVGGLSDLV